MLSKWIIREAGLIWEKAVINLVNGREQQKAIYNNNKKKKINWELKDNCG